MTGSSAGPRIDATGTSGSGRPILALVSPNYEAVSETFIQAHRRRLNAEVRFYSGGELPRQLEGQPLRSDSIRAQIAHRLIGRLRYSGLSREQAWVARSFAREGVEVVLAEYGTTGAELVPVCRALDLPLVVHFHGYDAADRSILERYAKSYREMFDFAHAVVVVSRAMERRLTALGCPPEKIVYNVYGPDESFLELPADRDRPPCFVAVGRFVDKKAPHCTLLAFRELLDRAPAAELVMIGDGPLWSACNDLARHLGMAGRVRLPGALPPGEVRGWLARSLAFVQHSVTARNGDTEGTPVAILEAMAAALPVVATRHEGIAEVVDDGASGWLVAENDLVAMADRMASLLRAPDAAREMGIRARQAVIERYSIARHLRELDALLVAAASRRAPGP